MSEARYLAPVTLSVVLLLGVCVSCGPKIEDAAGARDAALEYLREHYPENAPDTGLEWQEENTTLIFVLGIWVKKFTSNGLAVRVSAPLIKIDPEVIYPYTTAVASTLGGWHWQCEVEQNGTVTELSPLTEITEAWSQNIAEEFVRNSPTFTYDGIEETLVLTGTMLLRCPYCWAFTFEFDSRHAGYATLEHLALLGHITIQLPCNFPLVSVLKRDNMLYTVREQKFK